MVTLYDRPDISSEQFCLAPGKTYAVGRYPGPTPDSPDIGNKADNSISRDPSQWNTF